MMLESGQDFINGWWPIIISFIITVIASIRFYVAGSKCPSDNRIDGKVVLITGASGGIGLAAATELAKRGGKIILTCRDQIKGEAAVKLINETVPEAQIELRLLDVSSLKNIRDFVTDLRKDYETIDVLINNAGIIFHQYEKTKENFELTFVTNYLGPFLLSHLLIPMLKKSENGRIINVTSLAHFNAKIDLRNINFCKEFMFREAFGQTKLQLVLFTKWMSKLLGTSIIINSVNPGIVRDTNHLKNSPLGSSWMVRVSVCPWTWLFLKSPKQGSQGIIHLAVDPSINDISGEYFSDCEIKEASELVKNEELMEKLYEKSCALAGIAPL